MSSACNVRIYSLDELPEFPAFLDGDDCLFKYGTAELYDDAARYLARAGDSVIGMVSAHPDPGLMRERQAVLGVEVCPMPDRSIPHINKYSLFYRAATMMLESGRFDGISRVALVDDRWWNGAVAGQRAFRDAGLDSVSIFLERPDAKAHNVIDLALGGVQSVCARATKRIGIDTRFRPAA